ncbi:MAG: DUF6198 family protein [Clostridium sp.]
MGRNLKKLFLYAGGMFLIAIGINISKAAGLGISPVSAIPYAVELIWGIELGISTAVVYMFLIVLQMILLRKNYKPVQLLQFLATYALSFFITCTSRANLMFWMPEPKNYIVSIVYLVISIFVIGAGVSFYLMPQWIPLPAEGLAKAIETISKGKLPFHTCKSIVDTALVIISAALSLLFLGKLKSVREGTILAAILVGKVVGMVNKRLKDKIQRWLGHKKEESV